MFFFVLHIWDRNHFSSSGSFAGRMNCSETEIDIIRSGDACVLIRFESKNVDSSENYHFRLIFSEFVSVLNSAEVAVDPR